ncbi:MAG: acetate--CoA ligase, partial [Myxococcota bacterium]
ALLPWVAVAGDLDALGFGRLLALRTADGMRLVVLADTGGAFEGNLSQLDLYTGVYPSRAAFDAATSHVGDTAGAWILAARTDLPACR